MKDNGLMIYKKVWGMKIGQQENSTQVYIKMVKKINTEYVYSKMGKFILENGFQIKWKVKEFTFGNIKHMRVAGNKIKCMDLED